jgi:hypothetical protein
MWLLYQIVRASVCDKDAVTAACVGVECVFHLAAIVETRRYCERTLC